MPAGRFSNCSAFRSFRSFISFGSFKGFKSARGFSRFGHVRRFGPLAHGLLPAVALCAGAALWLGCAGAVYDARQLLGADARDLLADLVEEAQGDQHEARDQLETALAALKTLAAYDGAGVEGVHKKMRGEFKSAKGRVRRARRGLPAIEKRTRALIRDWDFESVKIADPGLRGESRRKLQALRESYDQLATALAGAGERMDLLLADLRDRVSYLELQLGPQDLRTVQQDLPEMTRTAERLESDMDNVDVAVKDFIEALRRR